GAIRMVMPGYFRVMGIPVVRGRDFDAADNTLRVPHRFIVNETFVKRFMSNEEPLGKRISVAMQQENPFGEIVGIVCDVKEGALDKGPAPTVYYNYAHLASTTMTFVMRAEGDPMGLAEPARRAIQEIDGAQPVADMRTMETVLGETYSRQRFSA